jgi:uncharacterized membrane protein
MIRVKHPIEYELTPDAVERGSHWLTVRIKNTRDNDLKNINIKMHSLDSLHISFHNPNHYIYDLESNEEKYFEVEVEANKTSHLYISIRGRKNGDHFHWDSGLMDELVLGDPGD